MKLIVVGVSRAGAGGVSLASKVSKAQPTLQKAAKIAFFFTFVGFQKVRVPEEGVEPTRGVIPGRF